MVSNSGQSINPIASMFARVTGEFAKREGMSPQNQIVATVTRAYLDALDPDDPPTPDVVEKQLLALLNGIYKQENSKAPTAQEKLPMARCLTCWQVAQILLHLHHVIRIAPASQDTDREYDLLAMYISKGRDRGVHSTSEDDLRVVARQYNLRLTLKEFQEVVAVLREDSPRKTECVHRDLIAVNNGIFYYGTADLHLLIDGREFRFPAKTLVQFDPALVFRAKSRVDYVDDPVNPMIAHPTDGTVWDIESWVRELSDDEGIPELLWEVLGALIRPHVSWNRTVWLYSEQGNNGKGTLCSLGRNLVGTGAHTSIPLSEFGKEFALEPLLHSTAIIVDENDVGTFVDKAANLKAVVTGDVIQINRKYRMPVAFQFRGFMVQCLNEYPRVKDKSESFYRRQLFVPFAKCFTGAEKRYIKDDYLQRRGVLEYALWYVLHEAGAAEPGSYYELSEPSVTRAVLAEYKETNDPVRAFWEEFRERLVWDLQPFSFLYHLYKAWFVDVSPSGFPVSRTQFITDLLAILRTDDLWHCKDKNRTIRPARMMDRPEPLIAEYDLIRWKSPTYKGSDPLKIGQPVKQANYRGVLRHVGPTPGAPDDADPTDNED